MTRTISTKSELRQARAELTGTVGVVMTMGALHEGHAYLLRQAREECDHVVATVFVNPLQFNDPKDYEAYQRTPDADVALCEAEGVDLVFMPSEEEMYPDGPPMIGITPGALGEVLEGAFRPGHFEGMLLVVHNLLLLTSADRAYFGQKDAQQLLLVQRMVSDLEIDTEIVPVPIVREDDGLARSSRNARLSEAEHEAALVLSRAMRVAVANASLGAKTVREEAAAVIASRPEVHVDYLALVNPATLAEVEDDHTGPALLAVAATVGTTRLIDNAPLTLG